MMLEMRITKLALQPAEVSDDTMQSRIIDATGGESLVEIRFFRQHLIAERHSRLLHLLEGRLRAAALVLREIESTREIEYVGGSRIAVELGRERHAHTAPRSKILDLLLRWRPEAAALHPGIGRGFRARSRNSGGYQSADNEHPERQHVSTLPQGQRRAGSLWAVAWLARLATFAE
jgi:hypothetical protein